MWDDLPVENKEQYKKLILAFASLTKILAQKASEDGGETIKPIIISKYQETVFCRAFGAFQEDVGNTAYDASLVQENADGTGKKYVIGIKTFGYDSGNQKIAQFKASHAVWEDWLANMKRNAQTATGRRKTKAEIDRANETLYLQLARYLSDLRNARIDSATALLRGFTEEHAGMELESVYHVLMPDNNGTSPQIMVGETSYDKIDKDNITSLGCTRANNPENFSFFDGNHRYSFSAADSQLYMDFENNEIVKETWPVRFFDDPYTLFMNVWEQLENGNGEARHTETLQGAGGNRQNVWSYSWPIAANGEVERFSGYNAFYGVSSKLNQAQRRRKVVQLKDKYHGIISTRRLNRITKSIAEFLQTRARSRAEKDVKADSRDELIKQVRAVGNTDFEADVVKLLYRPAEEMYIPIPHSRKFHEQNPGFFGTENQFNLVFEPSGNSIECFITQDDGKAIESKTSQSILGNWILREVFQLEQYQPLTYNKLERVGINGIRLYKQEGSEDVHLEFIWIDDDNPPEDLFE